MKVNRRKLTIFFMIVFFIELFLKGSHILSLVPLEFCTIAFLILAEKERSYFLIFSFILVSGLTEAVALQPIGITAVAALTAYWVVKLLVRFLAVIEEQRYFKLMLILCLAFFIKLGLNSWLSDFPAAVNLTGLFINLLVLLFCYFILNRLISNRHVFES